LLATARTAILCAFELELKALINDRHLIEGGQPAEVFERVLRQLGVAQ